MTSEGDKAEIITPINPVKQKEQQSNHSISIQTLMSPPVSPCNQPNAAPHS
jgi:hypothetical protein